MILHYPYHTKSRVNGVAYYQRREPAFGAKLLLQRQREKRRRKARAKARKR